MGLRHKAAHPTATVLHVRLTCPTKVEAGSESFLSVCITQHRVGGGCWTLCCTHTHTHMHVTPPTLVLQVLKGENRKPKA